MNRLVSTNFQPRIYTLSQQSQNQVAMATRVAVPAVDTCDVFISHRSTDTKRTLVPLIYDHLCRLGFHPFLDNKNMKPGDKLFEKIDPAIRDCKIGLTVISPRYCESKFCLHELALLMENKKKVIPIFCDVKPSELRVVNDRTWSRHDVRRFKWALGEAKYTVGLTFSSSQGIFSDIVTSATDIIIKTMLELDCNEQMPEPNLSMPL